MPPRYSTQYSCCFASFASFVFRVSFFVSDRAKNWTDSCCFSAMR